MRRFFISLLILLFCFSSFQSAASAPLPDGTVFYPRASIPFEHLAVGEGLSQGSVLALLQDRQGYLWVGTQEGLNRYDGYAFAHFKHDPNNPDSISSDSVIALYEDRDGFLWVGTAGGGLNRYDPRSSQFSHYLPDSRDSASLSSPVVTSIVQDAAGRLWVGTLAGLDLLDPLSAKFIHFRSSPTDPGTLSSDAISVIVPAGNGSFWIGTGADGVPGKGLNLFDPITEKVRRFPPTGDCLLSPNISSILVARDDFIWVGHGGSGLPGGGLDYFNPQTGQCRHYSAATTNGQFVGNNVVSLLSDREDRLWVAVRGGGLLRMEAGAPGSFASLLSDSVRPTESLSSDNTSTLLMDRSGILWVGTFDEGLNKLNLENLQFRVYRNNPADPLSISSNQINAFAETRGGEVWVGTRESGLELFNPATGQVTNYSYTSRNPSSLSSNRILSLYADFDGTLWVGTANSGLNHFDPVSGQFQRYQHDSSDPSSLLDNEVTFITRDSNNSLWVATLAGLSRLVPGGKDFINYTTLSGAPVALMANGTDLWVGTWGGGVSVLRLALPGSLLPPDQTRVYTVDVLSHNAANPNSLSENSVWALHRTADDGQLWFGTAHGLNRYDPKTGQFKIYTESSGLSSATIQCIVEDLDGYLWVTTANGLARFDRKSETFRNYDKNDGLQGNDFNTNACFLSPSTGNIYVGGSNGFTVFNPRTLVGNTTPPKVVITGLTAFDKQFAIDPDGKLPASLDYQQNFISISFAALDFHTPSKNVYRYMLDGFDHDWIDAGTNHSVKYAYLPAGDYTFRVRGANSDGTWSEQEASLPIQIVPPFWLNWQVQSIGLMLVLVLVIVGFQWRYRTIRKNAGLLEAVVRQRTTELRESNILLEREVEQRKRAETELARHAAEELHQSKERFRAVFESSAMGVVVMTLEQRIEQVNQTFTKLTGYDTDELAHLPLFGLAVREDRNMDRDLYAELADGKRDQYTIEKRYRRKDGSIFWARVSLSAVRGSAGQPLYTIGMLEDITEEKLAAERLTAQEAAHRRSLEKQIAKRTAELSKANDLLREKAAQDAVLAERTRLAHDLHDAVTQTLFSATLIADVLPKLWRMNRAEGSRRLDELRQLTRGALAEMRTLLVELRPNALVEIPLPILLRQLAEALIGRSRIDIELTCHGEHILPADVQVGLYRIAQEALNNIVKHSRATRAAITLDMAEDQVLMSVVDDGVGFAPAQVTADHLGIRIMRERAEAIGARFEIESAPNLETRISVCWKKA